MVLEREIEQHVQAAFETAKLPRLVSLYTSFQSYADFPRAHAICDESQPCCLLYEDIKRMESKYHEGVAASVIVRKDGPSLS